jgi:predicted TIM-barrel fold metal-dependent hydrolase
MSELVGRMERTFATDLERAVFELPLCDSHEHLHYEKVWTEDTSDVLRDLLNNYVPADLKTAGAGQKAIDRALDSKDPDIAGRLAGVLPALERCRYTGYGEAVYLIAKAVYGMETLTADGLAAAQPILDGLRKPGERLRLLRDVAGLEHTQTDDFVWPCLPDSSGPDFFFYDLSWRNFCNAEIQPEDLLKETGIEVKDLTSLEEAMTHLFDKYAPCAIAVKTQHAYNRTLEWRERNRADVEIALNKVLSHPGTEIAEEDRLCLGDWCWAKGVELATKHELPFKIHTGYYAGTNHMRVGCIKGGNLCEMLVKYPDARFLLMHISYPYNDEMVALAKHFPNVAVDLCWAWSIDPYSSKDFMRRMLHAVPLNRVMGFGGDTRHPTGSYAYSIQARTWLARTLGEEVHDGCLTEKEAIAVARRWMHENQAEYFQIFRKRETIRQWNGERLG